MKKHCVLSIQSGDENDKYSVEAFYETLDELENFLPQAKGSCIKYCVLDFSEKQLKKIKQLNKDEMPYEIVPIKGNKVRIIQF